jgi:uncharacterized protein (TIGR02266 family)
MDMPTAASSMPPRAREPVDEANFTKVPSAIEESRRVHPRFTVDLDVTVASDHNFYAGFAENLSAGGIFVATHKLLPVGETVKLSIRLPGMDEPIEGTGEVRWVREYSERSNVPPGLGFRFVELSSGASEAIKRFLENRDPLFFDD